MTCHAMDLKVTDRYQSVAHKPNQWYYETREVRHSIDAIAQNKRALLCFCFMPAVSIHYNPLSMCSIPTYSRKPSLFGLVLTCSAWGVSLHVHNMVFLAGAPLQWDFTQGAKSAKWVGQKLESLVHPWRYILPNPSLGHCPEHALHTSHGLLTVQ